MKKFAELDITAIVKKTGTPVFLFDGNLIISNYKRFLKSFSKYYPTEIFFSVKTNNELQVLKLLQGFGSSAQISSGMELFLCQKAGFNFNHMIMDGPGKSIDDLILAFQKGIYSYNGDSPADIKRANDIGKKIKKKINVGLRINPNVSGHLAKTVEFYLSKFGVPSQNALSEIKNLFYLKNINFIGLHAHIGSQVLSVEPFLKAIDILMKLAFDLKKENINIEYIDFGGGVPSPTLLRYSPMQAILKNILGFEFLPSVNNIEYYGEKISRRIKGNIEKYHLEGIRIIFEPGRSIVSNAGVVVAKVIAVKNEWVFLDASITFIPENVFFTERDLLVVGKTGQFRKYHIAGSSLLTPDFFARSKTLPQVKEDDLVVIKDCGAYTMSRSSQFTTMRPPIYIIENKKIRLIRRPDNYETFTGPMVD